jgi:Chemoreceptor zinc-binding domain
MGFFDLLFGRKDKASKDAPDSDTGAFDAATAKLILAEIDIEAAISAHQNWKVRLNSVLAGTSTEKLQPEVVCLDDRCDLGKWLHGSGKQRMNHLPAFSMLIARHKQFHLEASTVLATAQSGDLASATTMLNGNYQHTSVQVVTLLQHLKKGLQSSKG